MKKYNSLFLHYIRKRKYLITLILLFSFSTAKAHFINFNKDLNKNSTKINKKFNDIKLAEIKWENSIQKSTEIKWKEITDNEFKRFQIKFEDYSLENIKEATQLNSLNRSIVFDNNIIGPDISWIIPPGLAWNKKYKFDINTRGHNTQIPDPPEKSFFGWNDGDAVGLISYQFLHFPRSSFGVNFGVRSMYEGNSASGGESVLGDGLSAGFRWDYALSSKSGIAFGAEQLIHMDDKTDTGRNIYLTASKGWWSSEYEGTGIFPLYIATAGVGTGRMAVGNIRGLCSNFLEDGTDINRYGRLCWAPVFSLAAVLSEKYSTFFEFNGRFFLLGSSYAPFQNIPVRGSVALILSDHIDNYKFHNSSEMNWVFNISLGF